MFEDIHRSTEGHFKQEITGYRQRREQQQPIEQKSNADHFKARNKVSHSINYFQNDIGDIEFFHRDSTDFQRDQGTIEQYRFPTQGYSEM